MSQSGWVLWSAEFLSRVNTWPGRIHIHKILYLGDRLAGIEQPFEFKIYRYGPYSFDLDDSIRSLSSSSLLEQKIPDPHYGPKYSASSGFDKQLADSCLDLSPENKDKLSALAALLGDKRGKELELIATCIWAIEDEQIGDDAAVIARVHELKPRYDTDQIAEHLGKAKELKTACSKL